ncbi:TonB-dependent receptor [Gammaproteobacteria bacterium]|nr:TonB-dependent receptor [Gammaproteobacteria bacterium]
MLKKLLFIFPLVISANVFSQDEAVDSDVEEVVTVGSQIKGAKITGALPVNVLSVDDIEATGAVDGDELMEYIVEQGMNFFNEQEQTSGGVNAARGDTGAYNLRSMGVGNTLTLLNGRRLVLNAGYQTESIGGDFVPTMTVNTNLIPTVGLDRLEILKDGASAIYGADAVAGVVNNVLMTDYEGFQVSTRVTGHDRFDAVDADLNIKYGFTMNDGATNISMFMSQRDRERISACEDERWCDGNYERYLPEGSPWFGKGLNNTYTAPWYQLDFNMSNRDWAASGDDEAEMGIVGISPECNLEGAVDTGFGSCLFDTDAGSARTSPQTLRDYRGDLERTNLFVFINHEMESGNEFFAEIGRYKSKSNKNTMQGSMTSSIIYFPADYYWFTQLPAEANFSNTKTVSIDAGRPYNLGRNLDVKKEDYRYLMGFRGTLDSGWNWETAGVISKAEMNDVAHNRFAYDLIHAELNGDLRTTDKVWNIFSTDWDTNNSERIRVDVTRNDTSTLRMFDFKMSNPEIAQLPAGALGMLVGFEWRRETYEDERDPRLDGTIRNIDFRSNISKTKTFPYVSSVVGSSPTGDVYGEKEVKSLFLEFSIPVTDKINAQLATRHESFSDTKSTTVGKFAVGYDYSNWLKFRASASTSFRSPNIVQINQKEVVRTGSRYDALMQYGNYIENNKTDISTSTKGAFLGDYYVSNSLRYASGAENLVPEESTNTSIGFVMTPIDNLVITYDIWAIEKENTIGLFGRNNQSIYDLLLRKRAGIGGATTIAELETYCKANVNSVDATTGKYIIDGSSVLRDNYWGTGDDTDAHNAVFLAGGVCPAGEQDVIRDEYLNLATREVEGTDITILYDFDTSFGDFKITFQSSITDKFYQTPTGAFTEISNAVNSGELPSFLSLEGYGDIKGLDTTGPDQKDTLRVNYRNGDWGGQMSALKSSGGYDSGMKLIDGTMWKIEPMTTVNLSVYKKFELSGKDARIKLMVKNVADERAPLGDGYLGYMSDFHRDLGRNYYLDLRVDF